MKVAVAEKEGGNSASWVALVAAQEKGGGSVAGAAIAVAKAAVEETSSEGGNEIGFGNEIEIVIGTVDDSSMKERTLKRVSNPVLQAEGCKIARRSPRETKQRAAA
jgi:hypothetical protein